jgi:hypothetical protein
VPPPGRWLLWPPAPETAGHRGSMPSAALRLGDATRRSGEHRGGAGCDNGAPHTSNTTSKSRTVPNNRLKQTRATIRAMARSDGWRTITAKRPGRCDLCGTQFGRGARIRYEPATRRVRCLGKCQTLVTNSPRPAPLETKPKRIRARPVWQGEYVSLYDRGDYVWRKCASCGRDFETAAGRVAQAKKRGICPACEKKLDTDEVERMKERRLAQDREQWRLSKGGRARDGPPRAALSAVAAPNAEKVGPWYAATLAEDCDRCGARAGEPCTGKKAGAFHLSRYKRARERAGRPVRRSSE